MFVDLFVYAIINDYFVKTCFLKDNQFHTVTNLHKSLCCLSHLCLYDYAIRSISLCSRTPANIPSAPEVALPKLANRVHTNKALSVDFDFLTETFLELAAK